MTFSFIFGLKIHVAGLFWNENGYSAITQLLTIFMRADD